MTGEIKTMDWLVKEQELLQEERNKVFDESDFKPLYKLTEGEHKLTFDITKAPREANTRYGSRKVFDIKCGDVEYDFMVNPKSPFYRNLLEAFAAGKSELRILRSGEGIDTRVKILPDKKEATGNDGGDSGKDSK